MNTIETIENVQKQFPNVAFPNVYTTPAFYGRKEKRNSIEGCRIFTR